MAKWDGLQDGGPIWDMTRRSVGDGEGAWLSEWLVSVAQVKEWETLEGITLSPRRCGKAVRAISGLWLASELRDHSSISEMLLAT